MNWPPVSCLQCTAKRVLARLQSGPLLIDDWNNDVLRLKAFDYFDRLAVEVDLCVFVMVY